jgi:single-stranded-DNA-specific exonuclease
LLAQFDDIEAVTEILDAPGAATSGGASATAAGEFLDALYARKNEYLERDRFASIGEVDDFYTKIVGVSFEGRQDLVAGVRAGDALELERQPENEHDPNAIAVRFGTLHLGYLRREIARRLAPNIDGGDRYTASVGSVTGGGGRHVGVNIRVLRRRAVVPAVRAEARRELESTDALRVALIGERPLREAQRAVLDRLAAGRNTLAVLGTGRGKSLCFQLPAAERALERGEKTLVFYPLRALANDQYDALDKRLRRFGLRIFRANGAIDGQERAALEAALEDGSWDIILSTPEFATYHRHAFECAWNRPHLVVVDEAHHIFDSRHRAAYGTLGALVRDLGAPQVLALTATANDEAFREIRPNRAREPAGRRRAEHGRQERLSREPARRRRQGHRLHELARRSDEARGTASSAGGFIGGVLPRGRAERRTSPSRGSLSRRRGADRGRDLGVRRGDRFARRPRRRSVSPQFQFHRVQPNGRPRRA